MILSTHLKLVPILLKLLYAKLNLSLLLQYKTSEILKIEALFIEYLFSQTFQSGPPNTLTINNSTSICKSL